MPSSTPPYKSNLSWVQPLRGWEARAQDMRPGFPPAYFVNLGTASTHSACLQEYMEAYTARFVWARMRNSASGQEWPLRGRFCGSGDGISRRGGGEVDGGRGPLWPPPGGSFLGAG